MNKNRYRIVYNPARGMAMVVADITVSAYALTAPCAPDSRTASSRAFRLTRLSLGGLLAIGCISFPVQAKVVADSQASKHQQPTILQTANGIEQINIQAPSAAGVSHNNYTQFDIEQRGAILNNGRTTSQTQLAGQVAANPWLAKGEAKVILNEVNSRDPSLLNGMLEVAGRQADIIIANPAGITCDGCGFINANRTTLTTGQTHLTDGQVSHYSVQQGMIRVEGKGMDSTRQDSTELLARAVKINAALQAKALSITTGQNTIDARNGEVRVQTGEGSERPQFAIDVSQLGGMYANKIVLRGTEAGVGVHNAGTIGAAAGDVVISSQGTLTHRGHLQASQHIQLTSAGKLSSDGSLAAGIRRDGQASQTGSLLLSSDGAITLSGDNRAKQSVVVKASQITADSSQMHANRIELMASQGNIEIRKAVVVAQHIKVDSAQQLNNDAGHLSAETLSIKATGLSNRAGTLQHRGEQALTLSLQQGMDNHQGRLITQSQRLTLTGSQLNNQQGQISAAQIVISTTSSPLNNQQGVISASKQLALTSQGLDNDRGLIQAGESLTITAKQGRITNRETLQSGGIISQGRLTLSGDALENQQGLIASRDAAQLTTAALTNQAGRLLSGADLTVNTTGISNTQGLIQADQTLILTTQGSRLDNTQGELLAGKGIALESGALINLHGRIASKTDVTLQTTGQEFDNTAGQLAAGNRLQLDAGQLTNHQGSIQSFGDAQLSVTGQLDNSQGWLRSGQAMTLTAAALTNRGEKPTQQGIEGQSVTLHSQSLDNSGGAVRSQGDLVVRIDKDLTNHSGLLSAGQQLLVQGTSDTIVDNQAGTFVADQYLAIDAGALSGVGELLSHHAMQLSFDKRFLHLGRILAKGDIAASFQQGLDNQGLLSAGGLMTLRLPTLTNQHNGEINARQTIIQVQNTLLNQGLIDGGETLIHAGQLDNLAGGRLYGDHLAIETQRFTQRQEAGLSPITATRQHLSIATQSLNNLANSIIFSAGELVVGAKLDAQRRAQGQAAELRNTSATVEALGAMTLNSQLITNHNETLTTALVEVENATYHEAALSGSAQRYDWQDVDTRDKNKYGVHTAKMPDGTQGEDFYEYHYQRTVLETQIVKSDPGKIIAGGDLTLNSQQVTNQDSIVVAGGKLLGVIGSLNNLVTWGERITTDIGTVTRWYAKKKDRPIGGTVTSQGKRTSGYVPQPTTTTIDFQQLRWQEYRSGQGTGQTMAGRTSQVVTTEVAAASSLDSNSLQQPDAHQAINRVVSKTGKVIQFVPANVAIPDNALYQLRPATDDPFLIETDPRFTQSAQFLSSDRVFDQLSWTEGRLTKRLGDGFYEQALVREQITALTGSRFLQGFDNDEQQYRTLLDAGVAFAQRFHLTPGIALTAEQMAQLTSDMVWLVQQEVTLADGSRHKVLVPQVYAQVQSGDVTRQGGLLSAQQTQLQLTGDLVNSGTLVGRESVQIKAENITHRGDLLGREVALTALRDITQLGARLQAEQSLSLSAGRNITSQTVMAEEGENRWRDRPASIFVQNDGGSLRLHAQNDLILAGSLVESKGKGSHTQLSAGNDLQLTTVTATSHESLNWGKGNDRRITQTSELGSHIEGKGQITLLAGRDISLQAAKVSAGDALSLTAGRDLTLKSGQSQQWVTENSQQRSAGWLSSKTQTRHDSVSTTQALSSAVEGELVHLQAGHDLSLVGSRAIGSQQVIVQAGNDLSLTQAESSRQEVHRYEQKRKGLSGTGGIGFSYGQQTQRLTDEGRSVSHLGSLVGSSEGSVTMTAGTGLTLSGAELLAKRDIHLAAKEVTIAASEQHSSQSHFSEQKSSGFTLALSGNVGALVNQAISQATSASEEDSGRLAALKGVQSALTGGQAYQAVQTNSLSAEPAGSMVGINLSWGSQSSTSTKTHATQQHQASQLKAGNNITITADDGDIRLLGSRVQAGQDISLKATGDVVLESATDRQQVSGKNSSQGGSVGIGFNFGSGANGISVSASLNTAKGREKGNTLSHSETTLDAGEKLSIVSGRDTHLTGAQVSGKTVEMTVGRHLTLTSEQDTDDYASMQTSASVGGSASMGGGSLSLNLSRDKIDNTYASVQEQTGIFAGQGGFKIEVGQHTQLQGAVIGSTATEQNNRLDTGTLGFTDIRNHAQYKVEHQSVGMSSGGDPAGQLIKNAATSLLAGAQGAGNAESVTHSAISQGTLVVRDLAEQSQSLASLSRDVEHAHQTLSPIFDKEKEQNRLREAQLISRIGAQVANIAETQGKLSAAKTAKEKIAQLTPAQQEEIKARWLEQHPGQQLDERKLVESVYQQFYQQAINDSGLGVGGSVQRAIQAATAAVQGLAGGDIGTALAGGAAPYVANVIGHSDLDTFGKQFAHATVNAALAAAQGKSPLVGAGGAASAELVGLIATQAFGKEVSALKEDEKQTVSALATLAAGLAAGLVGGDTESTLTGMQVGKVTVENNWLSDKDIKTFTEKYTAAKTDSEKERLLADLKKQDAEKQRQALSTGISIADQKVALADLKALVASLECTAQCQELAAYSISELEPVANNTQLHENNIKKGILASVIIALTVDKPVSNNSAPGLSSLTKEQQQLINNAEYITTAKGIQNPFPRDLNEKVLWNGVKTNPSAGEVLKGINKDPRFPVSAGFQKMQVTHELPDGSNITIHYQYNSNTGKAYDMKMVTPQANPLQPGPSLKGK
ncbi:hemagglutinin repeat-containing protein [Rosenbergiella epipactidis]|uniref:hemagglutinin repeat-containing protein n=1 Tax=Rosenbergiella epipactidis TaxID=1544694 RepID=UPI001F4E3952|nr:hemagglutinin repeat-containing protein [Rosenbergiella epipactidis]